MTRVLILVEGQTEEAFVNRVLRPHLEPLGVYVERPSLLRTKELPEGKPYKGGITTYPRMSRDARRLLGDTAAHVSTLIDYYGLPEDFPGLASARLLPNVNDRVVALESAFADEINHPRFHPFLILHEIEAWVFAAPAAAQAHLTIEGLATELANAVTAAFGAELINDGPDTHPSIRLDEIVRRLDRQRRYGKVADGPEIIAKAGLDVIRAGCPHFNAWLNWLESLAA
jgi:Domain of unknown function (DUF4276)